MPVRDVPAPIDKPSAKAEPKARSRIRGWWRLMPMPHRKTQAPNRSPAPRQLEIKEKGQGLRWA